MADRHPRLVIDDLSGGRNGFDPAWAIANNEAATAHTAKPAAPENVLTIIFVFALYLCLIAH